MEPSRLFSIPFFLLSVGLGWLLYSLISYVLVGATSLDVLGIIIGLVLLSLFGFLLALFTVFSFIVGLTILLE